MRNIIEVIELFLNLISTQIFSLFPSNEIVLVIHEKTANVHRDVPPPPPPPRLSCSRLSQASVSYYASPITRSIIHDIQNTKGLYLYILCKIPINVREGAFHGPETFIRWKIWDMAVVTLLTRLNAY